MVRSQSKNSNGVVLSVQGLKTYFFGQRGTGKAVVDVSFDLHEGETLGLVGESGSGKSITALSILGLNPKPASRIVGGKVLLRGDDLLNKSPAQMRKVRGRNIGIVLQDPMTALNPVFSVGEQVYEPLRQHRKLSGNSLWQRAIELLKQVRIPDPESRLKNYPHQFSGGMRQRVVGAIALAGGPDVLIADEPTTSLDVTVQAAYLELLKEIQRESNLSILFITHDFGVVARMCHRVAVMYAGKVVELAGTRTIFESPAHPYTEALVRSVPDVQERVQRLMSIEGQPPSIYQKDTGCPFAPRCPYVKEQCLRESPPEVELGDGHRARCWRVHEQAESGITGSKQLEEVLSR
jgi:oligopeptide transport system ATP-binding protein